MSLTVIMKMQGEVRYITFKDAAAIIGDGTAGSSQATLKGFLKLETKQGIFAGAVNKKNVLAIIPTRFLPTSIVMGAICTLQSTQDTDPTASQT